LHNPNNSEDYCVADVESDLKEDNSIEDPECPEHWDVSARPNVPGLIRTKWKSKRNTKKLLVIVKAIKTRRDKGIKKHYD